MFVFNSKVFGIVISVLVCIQGCIDNVNTFNVTVDNTETGIVDDMVYIPAGEFYMGIDNDKLAWTDEFFIDRHEVSRGEYKIFCESTGKEFPSYKRKDWDENYPITGISFEDAQEYAKWIGKRLPTEAEWEKAARGGLDRKDYVWGDSPLIENLWFAVGNFTLGNELSTHISWSTQIGGDGRGIDLEPRIARLDINHYGIHHIGGNAAEYVSDLQFNDGKIYLKGPSYLHTYGYFRRNGRTVWVDGIKVGRRWIIKLSDINSSIRVKSAIGFRCVKDVN